MAEKKLFIGSAGPLLFDDEDPVSDPDGEFSGETQCGFNTDSTMRAQGEPTDPNDLVRKSDLEERLPSGLIAMWSGAVANIPTGWVLCDGNNGTPDLRDRFVVGAGSSYSFGDSGGNDTLSPATVGVATGTDHDVVDGGSFENRPSYYAIAFIMKT